MDVPARHEEFLADPPRLKCARSEDKLMRRGLVGPEFLHLVSDVTAATCRQLLEGEPVRIEAGEFSDTRRFDAGASDHRPAAAIDRKTYRS
jgi:hypothetical protein